MDPIEDLVLPSQDIIHAARFSLRLGLPDEGCGPEETRRHLTKDIVPGLNASSKSSRYYGFVTGGATPEATFADYLVTTHDQNVQVHLPNETVATNVEDAALRMLCELVGFETRQWPHRTFTTGATASNVLGLACGREYVIAEAARRKGTVASVSEDGIIEAMKQAGIERVQILTTVPHSSLRKAASIVGLGRTSVVDVSRANAKHRFNMAAVEAALTTPNTASILAISCSEVNTGLFATDAETMSSLRRLADKHGAWIHTDAAFGLLARVLPDTKSYHEIVNGVSNIQMTDSLTGDAHKLLNVPYDCGFFLSRHLALGSHVFQNPNAAYLNTASSETTASTERAIPSPLNIGIENSRRFRALPVYANLVSYGREGYRRMLERQIRLTREIASLVAQSEAFELLPRSSTPGQSFEKRLESIFVIAIFRAQDDQLNAELVQRINSTRKIYVSGTQWEGRPAARFAVANWHVDVEPDLALIKEVLTEVASSCKIE